MPPIEQRSTLQIDSLALTVRDLDRVARFYQEVVGLRVLDRDGDGARLGAGGTMLLELRRQANARPASPREAGLFHTAFLLPHRGDLARWMAHALRSRIAIEGAADHRVSEAMYLSDPEGNGVEITCDLPRDAWPWIDNRLAMATDPLDLDALMRDAAHGTWDGAPAGTTIGHVHLKVGAIAPAEAFYAGVLGVPLTARYSGGSFFGADGYHHHLAANIWKSRGAGSRAADATGLAEVAIQLADAAMVEGIERRAAAAGIATARHGAALSLRDPWGNVFTLIDREG